MTNKLTIFLLLLLPLTTLAQSKKKVLQSLQVECSDLEQQNDSILKVCQESSRKFQRVMDRYQKLYFTVSGNLVTTRSSHSELEKAMENHNFMISHFKLKDYKPIVMKQQELIPEMPDKYRSSLTKNSTSLLPDKVSVNENEKISENITRLTAYKTNLLKWKETALLYSTSIATEIKDLEKSTIELERFDADYQAITSQNNNQKSSVESAIYDMVAVIKQTGPGVPVPTRLESYFFPEKNQSSARDVEYDNWGLGGSVPPPPPPPPPVGESDIIAFPEEPAEFPGGQSALKAYLAKNVVYPQTAKEAGLEGTSYIQFIVSAKGNISNVKVVRNMADCPECVDFLF